jgi:hypothetical protein
MRTCGDRPSASVEARQDIKRKPPSAPRDEVVGCKQVCPAAQWPSLLRKAGARAEVTELDPGLCILRCGVRTPYVQ